MADHDDAAVGVVSKKRYAQHRGCTPPHIYNLIRQGKLGPPAVTPDGRIDVALADKMLGPPRQERATRIKPVTAPNAEDGGPVYAVERARRERAQAALAELQLAERQGKLLHTDAVRGAAVSVFGRATARIAEGFADLAVELAAMTDAGRIADRLAEHLRRNMSGLSEEFLADAARRSAA
jgi:hypothetical protein